MHGEPTRLAWKRLKHLGRYLLGQARTIFRYEWQGEEEEEVIGYSDSDWAGCRATGKSTSGGPPMIGGHFIKGWTKTKNLSRSVQQMLSSLHLLSAQANHSACAT